VPESTRNNVVNIVPVTSYSNSWKRKKAPSAYVAEVISLGISERRLRTILDDHLIDLDDPRADDWSGFHTKRRLRIYEALTRHLTEPTLESPTFCDIHGPT
jgi:hypothetical protein